MTDQVQYVVFMVGAFVTQIAAIIYGVWVFDAGRKLILGMAGSKDPLD